MKKLLITISFIAAGQWAWGQEPLTLHECYQLAIDSYPINGQQGLLQKSNELAIDNLNKNFLPQLELNAQASYQSEVTSVGIDLPAANIPSPDKDQYKATLDINQVIYDGGSTSKMKQVKTAELNSQVQQVEVSLYQVRERVNTLFFNIILLDEKLRLMQLVKDDVNAKLSAVRSGIKYGTVLPSNADILEAELLKIDQQAIEIKANKKAAAKMLEELIHRPVSDSTRLVKPQLNIENNDISRPELALFDYQQQQIEATIEATDTKNSPKLFAFAQAGYGKPGLNMLSNEFQDFYLAGLKLKWNFWDWNAKNNEKQILALNRQMIEQQKETFMLNTSIQLTQHQAEIEKIKMLIEKDREIIALRKKIVDKSSSQLDNGAITATEYITELNAKNQAEINLKTHETQLLLAQANYLTTQGTPENSTK